MAERRYDEYPQMARLVRAMSDEARAAVAHWHRVLTTALEGALPKLARESEAGLLQAGLTVDEACAARGGAEGAIVAWLAVMRSVAAIIVDPSEADWCCKPGMLASPAPCPQHGYDKDRERDYPLGTIIRRPYGEGTERAVKVYDNSETPYPWRSIEYPFSYNWVDLSRGNWTVVGRA